VSKRRVGLHEVVYERLSEAEKRSPHPPTEMLSGNDRGPIRMWVCSWARCHATQYTYTDHSPPVCFGGAQWSFSTDGIYREGVHRRNVAEWCWKDEEIV